MNQIEEIAARFEFDPADVQGLYDGIRKWIYETREDQDAPDKLDVLAEKLSELIEIIELPISRALKNDTFYDKAAEWSLSRWAGCIPGRELRTSAATLKKLRGELIKAHSPPPETRGGGRPRWFKTAVAEVRFFWEAHGRKYNTGDNKYGALAFTEGIIGLIAPDRAKSVRGQVKEEFTSLKKQ